MHIKEINKEDVKILWINNWSEFPTSGLLKYNNLDYYYEAVNHYRFSDCLSYVIFNEETNSIEDLEIEDLVVWYYIFEISSDDIDEMYKRRAYFELSKTSIESLNDYYSKNDKKLNLKSKNIKGFFRLSSKDLELLRDEHREQRFGQASFVFWRGYNTYQHR